MGKRRLTQNFEFFLQDLSEVVGSPQNSILCPLCLRSFAREAINIEDDEKALSEEHIIPHEVGGQWVTVACKKCNNELGSKVDSYLGKRLRDQASAEGKLKIRMSLKIKDVSVNCNIKWSPDPNEIIVMEAIGKSCNPAYLERAKHYFNEGEIEEISMTIREESIGFRYRIALLKIAYLGLFNLYGYKYILHPSVARIRDQINNYSRKQDFLDSVTWSIDPSQNLPAPFMYIPECKIMRSPCHLVLIRLEGEVVRHEAVFMPLPISESNGFYDDIREFPSSIKQGSLTINFKY